MNEKTAKLLNRYARTTGANSRALKREWLSLTGKERYEKRQVLLKELSGKK